MGYRRRSKTYRRRRNYKSSFRRPRISKTRRIMKRFMKRAALRPELKFAILQNTFGQSAATNTTTKVSQNDVSIGGDEQQRLGEQINVSKIYMRMYMADSSGNTGSTAPNYPDSRHRIIFWTPRVDYLLALAYMTLVTDQVSILDTNVVTIHKELNFALGSSYIDATGGATGVLAAASATPTVKFIDFVIPFPRKVKFGPTALTGNTIMNRNKDVLYASFITGRNPMTWSFSSKLIYSDS